ncbi:MAG: molybdopterin-dependent oxidoreductase [Deltaproteobacteria bacterium]|nr:molybdopterin-dependent oxidoreductase [Deltaproteobacteria bacterium]
MPDAAILDDRLAWTVAFTGVAAPRAISLAELQQMPSETVAAVIQCSGNGRKFFAHGPSGSKWATGAAGCALWTGVRVADVVAAMGGATAGAGFMTSTGGETLPEGVDPLSVRVERSIPSAKGLQDAMLVWEMNGEPIPLTHGGPVRLLVPGYYGCNQIKYVRSIAFTSEQTRCKIQHSGYRLRPIGEHGGPDQPSMWRMNVKSWLFGPGADDEPVLAGKVQLYGAALSGERGVRKVEVSLDGGESWSEAQLHGPDLGAAAWRIFGFEATLAPGTHTVHTRATDSEGEVQPEARQENERGYGHNGWRDHGLQLTVVAKLPPRRKKAAATAATAAGPAIARDSAKLSVDGKAGKALVQTGVQPACGACHTIGDAGLGGTVGPNLDVLQPTAEQVQSAVRNGVGAMPAFKGALSEAQIRQIATYIVEATKR